VPTAAVGTDVGRRQVMLCRRPPAVGPSAGSRSVFRKTLGKIVNLINYLVPVVFETFGAGDEDGPPRPDDILLLIGLRAEKLLPWPAGHTGDEQEQLHSNYR
jgi:hypothetical protein